MPGVCKPLQLQTSARLLETQQLKKQACQGLTIDACGGVILDAQVNVLIDAEPKVASVAEVLAQQLIFPHLQATVLQTGTPFAQ